MSTDKVLQTMTPLVPVESPLSVTELSTLLVKHYGLHSGLYDLLIEYQIGMGAVGPEPSKASPGVMIGISKVGLVLTQKLGPNTVDAGIVNPG